MLVSKYVAAASLIGVLAACSGGGGDVAEKPKGCPRALSASQVYRDLARSIEAGDTKGTRQGAIGWQAVALSMREAAEESDQSLKVWLNQAGKYASAISSAYRAGREPAATDSSGFGAALSDIDAACT